MREGESMRRTLWVVFGIVLGVGLGSAVDLSRAQAPQAPQAPPQAAAPAPAASPAVPPAPGRRFHQFCEQSDFRRAHAYVSERGQQGFEIASVTAVGGRHQVLLCFKKPM